MKRIIEEANAILTADIEIRNHPPICRTDEDYFQTFQDKMKWLVKLQQQHSCPVFDAGDLFDKKYKTHPSHSLLTWAMWNLPNFNMHTVPGNHDLPGKSIDNYENSAMSVLEMAGKIIVPYPEPATDEYADETEDVQIYGFPWGVEIKQPELTGKGKYNVALVHTMVYDGYPPFPGCEGYEKTELMKLLSGFDLTVTGHHHKTFTGKLGKTLLVNPGSFMRNDADQINHKPCVFLWYKKTNTVKKVYIPIKKRVINNVHYG